MELNKERAGNVSSIASNIINMEQNENGLGDCILHVASGIYCLKNERRKCAFFKLEQL